MKLFIYSLGILFNLIGSEKTYQSSMVLKIRRIFYLKVEDHCVTHKRNTNCTNTEIPFHLKQLISEQLYEEERRLSVEYPFIECATPEPDW